MARIYLTDDDRFLLDLYALKFKNAGHDVSTFSSGEELIDALGKKGAPDALLLDVIMPGLSGFETLEKIRQEKLAGSAKIIILTNQAQGADVEKAKSLGTAGYIVKASAIPSEVLAETERILAGSNAPSLIPAP
ncbi:MAG TPA: response regulator [Candidatus Paceibacterota bacterium]|nr:response regulator [Candidatus Paceibacterota bacterium]